MGPQIVIAAIAGEVVIVALVVLLVLSVVLMYYSRKAGRRLGERIRN